MIKEVLISETKFKDIKPIICGEEKCKSNHFYGPTTRDFFLIHFIMSGKGVFKTERGVYNLNEGDIFIIKPFEVTFYKADKINPWHYSWIGFEADKIFHKYLQKDKLQIPEIKYIFKDMNNSSNIKFGRELYLTGKIYEVLSYISMKDKKNTTSEEYVGMAKNYILSNYMKEISVIDISNKLGLERSYFSKIFKKNVGKSPQQFIIETRINKSIELMTLYNFAPTKAAINVGYNDFFNFSKMFKKIVGVSPKNYKNGNKNIK